ncbi:MAG: aconitate hydratase [Candidatus Omnitrophica bacterium]|nr:aconitate hydratase [Candidatus Omnitrophota bacterium]
MGDNIVYKILRKHLVSGDLVPGQEVGIKIDQTLTQDATGTMAYLQFEAMGIDRVKTELSVSYVDHNTIGQGFENADDHKYLQSVAAKYGVYFSRAGNGICHQVHLERFAKPGKTLLGSDSHTPTGGGIGAIAIGAGGLDVACAMGGGAFYLVAPEVIKVELTGKLRDWVSAKDVILHLLGILSTKGNVNKVIEYSGEGLKTLSVPGRATITNMGAETGATTSIFPSDEVTKQFLTAQNRADDFCPLVADEGAKYCKVIKINLSEVVAMAALPHSPGNVVTVKEIAGKKVDQVAIGSCTNGSLKDLTIVGEILAGKTIHQGLSVIVSPGSRQVFSMISADDTLNNIINSGARIMEPTCGFCIGSGQSPCTDGISVRTNNRNFCGRSGTESGQIYLVSPQIAALAAINGEFVDPFSAQENYPQVSNAEHFYVDDRMIIPPPNDPCGVEIFRGPNIGQPPTNIALVDSLSGEILVKVGDKITTDHIMPAGPRLKYRSNIDKYSEFVFEGVDSQFAVNAKKLRDQKKSVFILAGESYGQGSSREHAAMCPMYLGVRAVMAKSFERIHITNLINFGILPLTFINAGDYELLQKGLLIQINNIIECLNNNNSITVLSGDIKIEMNCTLSLRQRQIVQAGGLLNYTRQ